MSKFIEIEEKIIDYKSNPWGWQVSNGYDDFCVHNTANDATADQEWSFLNSRARTGYGYATYHIVVDENKAIQCMPYEVDAWAVSDGTGKGGNTTDIHIEIARSTDSEHYPKAYENAMKVIAQLCYEFGWKPDGRIKFHYDYGTKYCPHHSLNDFGGDGYIGSTKSNQAATDLRKDIVKRVNNILNNESEEGMKELNADKYSNLDRILEDEKARYGGKYKIYPSRDLTIFIYDPKTKKLTRTDSVLPGGSDGDETKRATSDYAFKKKNSKGGISIYHRITNTHPLDSTIRVVSIGEEK